VWAPDERSSFSGLALTRSAVYLEVLRDVQGQILLAARENGRWSAKALPFPAGAALELSSYDPFGERLLVNAEGFILPTTLLGLENAGAQPESWKSIPARFDAAGLAVEQRWATRRSSRTSSCAGRARRSTAPRPPCSTATAASRTA
jgi:prolyl oligopeptidase